MLITEEEKNWPFSRHISPVTGVQHSRHISPVTGVQHSRHISSRHISPVTGVQHSYKSMYHVLLQEEEWFRGYHPNKQMKFWTFTMTLTLNTAILYFRWTLWLMIIYHQVWLQKRHWFRIHLYGKNIFFLYHCFTSTATIRTVRTVRMTTLTFTHLLSSDGRNDDDELMLNVLRCHLTY